MVPCGSWLVPLLLLHRCCAEIRSVYGSTSEYLILTPGAQAWPGQPRWEPRDIVRNRLQLEEVSLSTARDQRERPAVRAGTGLLQCRTTPCVQPSQLGHLAVSPLFDHAVAVAVVVTCPCRRFPLWRLVLRLGGHSCQKGPALNPVKYCSPALGTNQSNSQVL